MFKTAYSKDSRDSSRFSLMQLFSYRTSSEEKDKVSSEAKVKASNEAKGQAKGQTSNVAGGQASNEAKGQASNYENVKVSNEAKGQASNEEKVKAWTEAKGQASNEAKGQASSEAKGKAPPTKPEGGKQKDQLHPDGHTMHEEGLDESASQGDLETRYSKPFLVKQRERIFSLNLANKRAKKARRVHTHESSGKRGDGHGYPTSQSGSSTVARIKHLWQHSSCNEPSHSHSKESHSVSFEENEFRSNWILTADYYIFLIGATIGLNALRFPFLAYQHGVGAFVLVYVFCSLLFGLPLVYLDISWGQFCSRGPVGCYSVAPILKGVGLGIVAASCIQMILDGVSLVYVCCYILAQQLDSYATCSNDTCLLAASNNSFYVVQNHTEHFVMQSQLTTYPTAPSYYFRHELLQMPKEEADDSSGISVPQLLLGQLITWFLCYMILRNGVHSVSKMLIFPVGLLPFLYVCLFTATLAINSPYNGAFLFRAKDFANPSLYLSAVEHMTLSLGIGRGVLTTLSSYRKYRSPVQIPTVLVIFFDCASSILFTFIIFLLMAVLQPDVAHSLTNSGTEIVLEAVPLSLLHRQSRGNSLAYSLFFPVVAFLGMSSQLARFEVLVTAMIDNRQFCRDHQPTIVGIVCTLCCVVSIPFTTPESYILKLILETYICTATTLVLVVFNLLTVVVIYGTHRYMKDMKFMHNAESKNTRKYLIVAWTAILPIYFILSLVSFSRCGEPIPPNWKDVVENSGIAYSGLMILVGWVLRLLPLLCIALVFVREIHSRPPHVTIIQHVQAALKPSDYWGPDLGEHRDRTDYDKQVMSASSLSQIATSSPKVISNSNTPPQPVRGIMKNPSPDLDTGIDRSPTKGKVTLSLGGSSYTPVEPTTTEVEHDQLSMCTFSSLDNLETAYDEPPLHLLSVSDQVLNRFAGRSQEAKPD